MRKTGTLKDVGEDAAITALLSTLGKRDGALVGPGDDCAVVAVEGAAEDWLLTSDPVIEGVHFLPDTEPRMIGRKAVGRVLSDIAAMGGEPVWLLVNVTAPAECAVARLKAMYRAARSLCGKYGAAIVGGDVARGPTLSLHVFGIGRTPRGAALRRMGARPGDGIYVTGLLGGSGAGRHLSFEPRITEGLWLREQGWPSSMMDVSDGVATDLRRLIKMNQVGAELDVASIPIAKAARDAGDGRSPWYHALTDGEDYELLFTVPAERRSAFESSWKDTFRLPCTPIGRVNARKHRLTIRDEKGRVSLWGEHGYEHFVSLPEKRRASGK